MDCRTALEMLEAVRPNSGDLQEPELAEAGAHLEACPQCVTVFQGRQTFDREIADAMQDIAIPLGLKKRLLRAIEIDESAAEQPTLACDAETATPGALQHDEQEPVAAASRFNRRRWLRVAASVSACCMAAVAGWYFVANSGSTYTVDELRASVVWDWDRLAEFDGSFDVSLPSGWDRNPRLHVSVVPRGILQESTGKHVAAEYAFAFRPRSRTPISGLLLAIPRDCVASPPAEASFSFVPVRYTATSPDGPLTTATWSEGGFVYVCFVQGGAERLEAIQQALEPRLG
jgi:hypothetical protein